MVMYKDIRNICLEPVSVPRVSGTSLPIFRCGHCVNCLKQKANELAVRAFREFHGQSVAFLTFTYDNVHCPIQKLHYDIDTETGEILKESRSIVRDASFFERAEYTIHRNKKMYSRRYKPLIECNSIDALNFMSMDILYPSVYYEDIKKLLKRFRQTFPKKLSHFICVPEYGSLGYRPHYHFMCFGLDNTHLDYLAKHWDNGTVDVRYPRSSDFREIGKLSMYIAKYCTKGKFDCPYIRQGYCIKPRRSVSEHFGYGSDFDRLKAVVLATEQTKIDDPFFLNDCPPDLNEYTLQLLADRRSYNINGFHYPFPKYLLNKIFKKSIRVVSYDYLQRLYKKGSPKYIKLHLKYGDKFIIPDGDKAKGIPKTYKVVSSPLQNEVARYILVNLVSDSLREQRESYRNFQDLSLFFEKLSFEEWSFSAAREALEKQFFSDMYNNSIY